MSPVKHRGCVFVDFSCHLSSFDPPPDLWGETPFLSPDQQWPLQQGPSALSRRGRLGSVHGCRPGQGLAAPGRGHPASVKSPVPQVPKSPAQWHLGGEEQPAAYCSDTPLHPSQPRVRFSLPRTRDGKWVLRAVIHCVLCVPLPCPLCRTAVCVCWVESGGRRGGGGGGLSPRVGSPYGAGLGLVGPIVSCSVERPGGHCWGSVVEHYSSGSPSLVPECTTGFVPTSCLQLPGGPSPGLHDPNSEARVSWGTLGP